VVQMTIIDIVRNRLGQKGISLSITPTEARFSQSLPNECQDSTKCGCRVETRDMNIFAAIKKTSALTSHNRLFDDNGIILEAIIDAEIGATGNIRAKGTLRDLGDIRVRKKRSPGFGKRLKKAAKKVWKKTSHFCQSNALQSAACSYMINAGIGAAGKRKKRSPGFGKRFKKAFKKTWVNLSL